MAFNSSFGALTSPRLLGEHRFASFKKDWFLPLLITFQGKPVKRRQRIGNRLKLLFYSPTLGQPGQQLTVTQDEWRKFGRVQFVTRDQMPDVRRLSGA